MAVGAEGAGGARWMMRVRRRVETAARIEAGKALRLCLGMALGADRIALRLERRLMLAVAVQADDAGSSHPALLEGAVFEHLVEDLPVEKVEIGAQQIGREMIEKCLARPVTAEKLRSSRMAAKADILVGRRQAEVGDRL